MLAGRRNPFVTRLDNMSEIQLGFLFLSAVFECGLAL